MQVLGVCNISWQDKGEGGAGVGGGGWGEEAGLMGEGLALQQRPNLGGTRRKRALSREQT